MRTFYQMLLEVDFNYISIGHNYNGNYDAWVLPRRADDIKLSSEEGGGDPEFFHDKWGRYDYKGRVDHDKKMASITSDGYDDDRLKYVLSILRSRFPGYKIWLFGKGSPKLLA